MTTFFVLLTFLWQQPSFLDQWIASAREKIAKEPQKCEGYNELAMALARKDRETGDVSLLNQAEDAVRKSLKLEPANFDGRKARVAIRLRQKRYEDALEEAQALNRQMPDDNSIYGFVSEAQSALGNYQEAEKAVQRMLDLRQLNGPGMERGAVVRELIGYPDGAIDWWASALHLASDRDTEERAYIESQMARVYRETGKYDAGVQAAQRALQLRPEYAPALMELARIRIEQSAGNPKLAGEAVELLRTHLLRTRLLRTGLKMSADLESMYWIGRALDALGQQEEAASAYATFEKEARSTVKTPAHANALLVRFWADHGKAAEAVALGRESIRKRQDPFTLEAYAWALLQSGDTAAALEQMKKALEPGMRDAGLYFDAGVIALTAGDSAASGYFKKSFEINANSPYAARILKQLSGMPNSSQN